METSFDDVARTWKRTTLPTKGRAARRAARAVAATPLASLYESSNSLACSKGAGKGGKRRKEVSRGGEKRGEKERRERRISVFGLDLPFEMDFSIYHLIISPFEIVTMNQKRRKKKT